MNRRLQYPQALLNLVLSCIQRRHETQTMWAGRIHQEAMVPGVLHYGKPDVRVEFQSEEHPLAADLTQAQCRRKLPQSVFQAETCVTAPRQKSSVSSARMTASPTAQTRGFPQNVPP